MELKQRVVDYDKELSYSYVLEIHPLDFAASRQTAPENFDQVDICIKLGVREILMSL